MAVAWGQLRTLIADDQRFILSILFHILKELGAKPENIFQATNGDDAVKILASVPVDLAICDINMGPGNGLALLRRIRSGEARVARDLPFIFLTAHADAPTLKIAMQLDTNGFIVKPVAKKQLSTKIEAVMANRKPLPDGKNYFEISIELSDAIKAAAAMDGTLGAALARQHEAATQAAQSDTLHVPIDDLQEGDTPTHDILSGDGTVLAAAGSPLSRDDIDSLVAVKGLLKFTEIVIAPRKRA
jgi:DNA-binding NarL/FixJ family response regulator